MATPATGLRAEPSKGAQSNAKAAWFRSPLAVWLIAGSSLFIAIYLIALLVAPHAHDPGMWLIANGFGTPFANEISKWLSVGLCFALAFAVPKLGAKKFQRLEGAISRFALHRRQAILLCAVLPVLVRLALLPILRVPEPIIADEFGYLLLANTFASGRLTNPAHPLWKFFEGNYILHQPTYTSQYPFASAILMAIPEIFGATPWLGVCLGVGLMCGLICWMLQAWVPPKWALLGGLVAVGQFAIVTPWMNTYWGGSTAAIGGALVAGAAPRIMKYCRVRDSVLFGLGFAILSQSRPFEGLLFSIPVLAWLAVWVIRERKIPFDLRLRNVVVPVFSIFILLGAGTVYYNWRVTGYPLLMPYKLHQRIYGTPQPFYFQPAIQDAPGIHRQKDREDVFRWELDAHEGRLADFHELSRLLTFWRFYLGPFFTIPLLFLPFLWRDLRLRLLLFAATLLLAGNSLYPFFFTHYAAPLSAAIVFFVIQGLRCLRMLRVGSRAVGLLASRGLILMAGVSGLSTVVGWTLTPWTVASDKPRSKVYAQLKDGKHVVLVRYSDDHLFHYGVVFNDADIDNSRIVWAHDLGETADHEIEKYYPDRQFWLYNPDAAPGALAPMAGQPYFTEAVDGAGSRDYLREGVCPGGIAVLLGGNIASNLQGTTFNLLGLLPVHLTGVSAQYGDEFSPGKNLSAAESPDDISVQFGDDSAAILGVSRFGSQESVTVQVPFETAPGLVTVKLRRGDFMWPQKIRVLPAAPGVFQMRMSDSKLRGIMLRQDRSFVDLEHPAHRGEILRFFANGLGAFKPSVRTGEVGLSTPMAQPTLPLIVGVDYRRAPMISAKYAAGMIGVTEVTFQVPLETRSGTDINFSIAAVVDGKPMYSNASLIPVQ